MPIFEYRCKKCGHVSEVLVKGQRARRPRCEKCGSRKTEKVFSSFAVGISGPPGSSAKCSTCPDRTCPMR